jgi:hypothetical protein
MTTPPGFGSAESCGSGRRGERLKVREDMLNASSWQLRQWVIESDEKIDIGEVKSM